MPALRLPRTPLLALGVAVAALAGLGQARGDGPPVAAGTHRRGAPAPPALPGPAPRPRAGAGDPAVANAACAACHATVAAEWSGSLHQQAWTDPVFQTAYALEPVAFCRGCHAPEADPAGDPGAGARAVGIGCVTCHVEAGHVVGASPAAAPHPVLADARLATEAACGNCHQFDFPREPQPMQDTGAEHARSTFAAVACQSCHMPAVAPGPGEARGHRSHAFSVIRSPAMIRRAASLSAVRTGPRGLEVTVAPAGAGHAFPTGDMFRRLEVRAEALDAKGAVVARAEPVFLGRIFADVQRDPAAGPGASLAFHRVQASDTRVPPPGAAGRVVELRFARALPAARVRWAVVYERMGSAMAASLGVDRPVDEIVVGEGELPPWVEGGGTR